MGWVKNPHNILVHNIVGLEEIRLCFCCVHFSPDIIIVLTPVETVKRA